MKCAPNKRGVKRAHSPAQQCARLVLLPGGIVQDLVGPIQPLQHLIKLLFSLHRVSLHACTECHSMHARIIAPAIGRKWRARTTDTEPFKQVSEKYNRQGYASQGEPRYDCMCSRLRPRGTRKQTPGKRTQQGAASETTINLTAPGRAT